ncbi:MAG: hypothetical protein IPO77_00550 [Acidobacteria bacterium]|nr:hypothetical protein [Acidobacteriota bacterium]
MAEITIEEFTTGFIKSVGETPVSMRSSSSLSMMEGFIWIDGKMCPIQLPMKINPLTSP